MMVLSFSEDQLMVFCAYGIAVNSHCLTDDKLSGDQGSHTNPIIACGNDWCKRACLLRYGDKKYLKDFNPSGMSF